MSTFIENGQVFLEGRLVKANLVLSDGKIHEITQDRVTCEKYVDASGKTIIPGMIDSHVHFREPGLAHKEDFLSGSLAAAAGGVTTILDMPDTVPPTTTVDLLNEKRQLAKKSIVNYGFHFAATADNLDEIRKARNIASVKVFMNESMAETVISREDALRRIFVNCRKISVHAEGEKVAQAINLVKETKSRLYLCHLSSAQDVAHLKKYLKAKVFGEVSPHHLFLTADDDKDCFTKMKPTLKTKSDQAALWKAMEQGLIDTVGSDHAPHTIEEKGQDNFPYGVPGVETTLPLLLNAVNNKRLTLNKLVELCCENPAKIFGIADKGFIRPGYDADLVIVDMNLEKEVRNQELLTRCKWSPFNGWKLRGWPVTTIVKGKAVFDKGKTTNDTGKEVKFYF